MTEIGKKYINDSEMVVAINGYIDLEKVDKKRPTKKTVMVDETK